MTPEIQLLDQILSDCNEHSIWCADENIAGFIPAAFKGNIISNRFDIAAQLQRQYPATYFCDFNFYSSTIGSVQCIVFRIAKEKAINLHIIAEAFRYLQQGNKLILLGYKNEGINSLRSFIEENFDGEIIVTKHKKQLQLIEVISTGMQPKSITVSNYAALQKQVVGETVFFSKPGIFGWNKIDRGSELLIEALNSFLSSSASFSSLSLKNSTLLDLGCGYGYLSIKARELGFTNINATDNNAAAINACSHNFKLYDIQGDVIADNHAENHQKKYDIILCNPPFHKGFDHTKGLTKVFTQQSFALLKPGGMAFFVTNQFIAIEKIAEKLFSSTVLLLKKDGFKVHLFIRQ